MGFSVKGGRYSTRSTVLSMCFSRVCSAPAFLRYSLVLVVAAKCTIHTSPPTRTAATATQHTHTPTPHTHTPVRGSTLRSVDGRAVWPLVNFLALSPWPCPCSSSSWARSTPSSLLVVYESDTYAALVPLTYRISLPTSLPIAHSCQRPRWPDGKKERSMLC